MRDSQEGIQSGRLYRKLTTHQKPSGKHPKLATLSRQALVDITKVDPVTLLSSRSISQAKQRSYYYRTSNKEIPLSKLPQRVCSHLAVLTDSVETQDGVVREQGALDSSKPPGGQEISQ